MKPASPRLNSFFKACLVAVCALLLNACEVTFTSPLPESLFAAGRDEQLLGRWKAEDEPEEKGYVRIVEGENDEVLVRFESGDPDNVLRATTLKIDNSSYLKLTDEDSTKRKGYMLVRYTIVGDSLKVWLLDDKRVREAIRDGKLKGEFGPETYSGASVTDSPEKILGYIRTGGDDAFKFLNEFRKVADK